MKENIYLCIIKKDEIIIDQEIIFPSFIKREESKKAYTLLKNILEYIGLEFNINDIKISKYGKPFFKSEIIKFNYSHSKNYIAVCVSIDDVGIDIEDDFEISKEASKLYLNGLTDNLRYNWVLKEAYFKLKEKFNDSDFIKKDLNNIDVNKYINDNDKYTCIICYKEEKKVIVL